MNRFSSKSNIVIINIIVIKRFYYVDRYNVDIFF